MSRNVTRRKALARELPFHGITNPELYNIIENTEIEMKRLLNNSDVYNLIKATQHGSNVIENSCRYYTTEDFINEYNRKYSHKKNNQFSLMHLNIRSLDKNWTSLMGLLKTLEVDFDIIALSEIGRKNIENREAQLKKYGYNMIYDKPTLIRGGTAIIYKSNFDISEREDLKIIHENNETHVENTWLEVKFGNNPSDKTIVGCIYKHPGGPIKDLKNFRHKLEQNLLLTNSEKKQCIITGDLNIDGLKIKTNSEVENFFNMLLEHNFLPTITNPTRIVNNSELHISLIDHILINSQVVKNSAKVSSGNIYSDISDHLPNFIITDKKQPKKTAHKRPTIRILGDKNKAKYNQLLRDANWEEFYKADDVNMALQIFYKIHNQAFNNAFPLKQLSRKRSKDKMWMSLGLRKSINKKNQLYKTSLMKPTSRNIEKYKEYRNILAKCLKSAEQTYYMNIIESEKKP